MASPTLRPRPQQARSGPPPRARRRAVTLACGLAVLVVLVAVGAPGGRTGARNVPSAYAVGLRIVPLVDRRRSAVVGGQKLTRTLTTYVRYPAAGPAGFAARPGAPPAQGGPYPLIVFGHGFRYTQATYRRLLTAWASAGYVVAAPNFPLENANAPGGPNRIDLPKQPEDVRFVIGRLLAASAARSGPLSGLIDPRRLAVGGHSDGGNTALAVAFAGPVRDRRVRAVVVLAGAQLSGVTDWDYRRPGPALLAVQGSADTVNPPADTRAFWTRAEGPKYLLTLTGAGHVAPYTQPGRQLSVVVRATTDFLDRYLRADAEAGRRLLELRDPPRFDLQVRLEPGSR